MAEAYSLNCPVCLLVTKSSALTLLTTNKLKLCKWPRTIGVPILVYFKTVKPQQKIRGYQRHADPSVLHNSLVDVDDDWVVWKLLVFKNSLKPPKSGVESNETGDSCAKTKPDKSCSTSRCARSDQNQFLARTILNEKVQLVRLSTQWICVNQILVSSQSHGWGVFSTSAIINWRIPWPPPLKGEAGDDRWGMHDSYLLVKVKLFSKFWPWNKVKTTKSIFWDCFLICSVFTKMYYKAIMAPFGV